MTKKIKTRLHPLVFKAIVKEANAEEILLLLKEYRNNEFEVSK